MENDNIKTDLLRNEISPHEDSPPPYSTNVESSYLAPSVGPPLHQPASPSSAPSLSQQPHQQFHHQQTHVHQSVPPYPHGVQVVQQVGVSSCPADQVFAQEECFAECVRFWWCRPIGWLAKGELSRARTLYLAGDYQEAQAAARCANVWSTVGLISGLVVVAAVIVAVYFIVAYGIS
ncbi:uncharacterized protein LOC110981202 [Acanthaster planci]|uniref:Uncharacterized protein LOC110981202 n=1 Tax=Acanthaster planci TaxID=133434 RepID=A0A8B7YP85_ACAPL|nr:uncharacterized protein LOC110981202 [Acanthaster planci]